MHTVAKTSHPHGHGHGHTRAAAGGSTDNLKKLGRNASATNVRKNSSHVSLKRNQSSGDVSRNKALKLAAEERKEEGKRRKEGGVHFEIGDHDVDAGEDEDDEEEEVDGDADGWEEASSSASPALSRSASRPNSAKQSANNSEPQSPLGTTFKSQPLNQTPNVGGDGALDREKEKRHHHPSADAKIITERLLQRVPSHNTTKMTLATATPLQAKPTSASRTASSQKVDQTSSGQTSNSASQYNSKEEVISRFVSGSGTPHEPDFLSTRTTTTSSSTSPSKSHQDDMKRAQSMGNLSRQDSSRLHSEREDGDYDDNDDDRPLAPRTRSRKSSTGNAYTPPHTQSRTQQKLWLQRASSNIDPQNLAHPPPSLGVAALGLGYAGAGGVAGLVGSGVGYDGKDPRIKAQLERTGLEYLVVRRYQDPVGAALKRLDKLPGAGKNRKIPAAVVKVKDNGGSAGRKGGLGLSQSLKDVRKGGTGTGTATGATTTGSATPTSGTFSTGDAAPPKDSYGSQGDASGGAGASASAREDGDDGISAILRSLWEKNFDFSSSAD